MHFIINSFPKLAYLLREALLGVRLARTTILFNRIHGIVAKRYALLKDKNSWKSGVEFLPQKA